MDAGRFDKRATFRKREAVSRPGGNTRGDFADFLTVWAAYREYSAREIAQMGQAEDVPSGLLTIRDCTQARELNNADRVVIRGGGDFSIQNVGLPDGGLIRIRVSRTIGG